MQVLKDKSNAPTYTQKQGNLPDKSDSAPTDTTSKLPAAQRGAPEGVTPFSEASRTMQSRIADYYNANKEAFSNLHADRGTAVKFMRGLEQAAGLSRNYLVDAKFDVWKVDENGRPSNTGNFHATESAIFYDIKGLPKIIIGGPTGVEVRIAK
jgi:hypothetical protein